MEKYNDIVSQLEKLTVVEVAELVKALEEKWGISAAPPAGGASIGAADGAAAAEEKTSFNVLLKAGGEQKINVIKVIREAVGLGLKEAKDLVDAAPKEVMAQVNKKTAEEAKEKLTTAGATVELK